MSPHNSNNDSDNDNDDDMDIFSLAPPRKDQEKIIKNSSKMSPSFSLFLSRGKIYELSNVSVEPGHFRVRSSRQKCKAKALFMHALQT
jgi:hypothetical protein